MTKNNVKIGLTESLISEAIKSNLFKAKHFLYFRAIARSSGLSNGGGCAKLQELEGLTISISYKTSWEKESLNLTELAKLRWIEEWKIERLADHFGVCKTSIRDRLRYIKRNPKKFSLKIHQGIIRGK